MDINSAFITSSIDRSQNYFEGIASLDLANPALPALEEVGKTFNTLQVKNPSVCKNLLVTYEIKQKDGTLSEEKLVLCPNEINGHTYKRPAITKVVKIEILDTAAFTPGAWADSAAYAPLAAPTADDFAEDGGSIAGIVVRLLDC